MRDLTKLTEYELLDQIVDPDASVAEMAFVELHSRHLGFMANVARNLAYQKYPRQGEEVAEDILGNSVEKMLMNIRGFRKQHGVTPPKQRNHVRTWLYKIVERSFIDYIRQGIETVAYEDVMEINNVPDMVGTARPVLSVLNKDRIAEIHEAALELSEKEQFILMGFVRYGKIEDSGNWVLDQEAMESLCAKYNLKPNTVYQAKRRILEKIKRIIQKRRHETK